MTPSPSSQAPRPQPTLSLKMQGKAPLRALRPAPKRPEAPPREGSKMAMDFYVASMLESQVRQLMTEPDGMIHLERCPTPYRKFLLPSPNALTREGIPFFEEQVDQEEETSVAWFESAMDALESWMRRLYKMLPSFQKNAKKESTAPATLAPDLERGHTPMFVENQPDTPGSQATPKAGENYDQPSYFALE